MNKNEDIFVARSANGLNKTLPTHKEECEIQNLTKIYFILFYYKINCFRIPLTPEFYNWSEFI